MKLLNLRRRAETIEKFMSFPKTIQHDKFGYAYNCKEPTWIGPKYTCRLRIDVVMDSNYVMHKNNTGDYRIAYVIEGFDGEEQALPFESEELIEMIECGAIFYSGGLYGDDLGELIEKMYRWLKSEGYIT